MRVTRETREKTRQGIVEAARELFLEDGFEGVTTRAIARRAGIAAGTLFNYFPSKEALAVALVGEALAAAEAEFDAARRPGETLEETLFAFVAAQLRHMAPYRPWVAPVLEASSSLLRAANEKLGAGIRAQHLQRVERWLAQAGIEEGAPVDHTITLHLYWSLFLGVVRFWSQDSTRNQEGTLALLDRSMGLFCRSVQETSNRGERS